MKIWDKTSFPDNMHIGGVIELEYLEKCEFKENRQIEE
jgi:hypothetical protein